MKLASVTSLNRQSDLQNWRAAVGDILAEDGVRGVIVTVFYDDRRYMVRQVNVANSDLALAGAKLLSLASEES